MTEHTAALASQPIGRETLAALIEASAAITSSLDLGHTLREIASSAAEVLGGEASSVLLLEPRRNKLIFRAAFPAASEGLLNKEFDATRGIAGKVVSTGQPLRVPDVRRDPDFYSEIDAKSDFRTRDILAAPLRHREKVIGVVEVLNRRGGGQFSDSDLEILQVFANLAAIGVANAQMHEQLKRENRGLIESAKPDERIIGAGPGLRTVLALCDRVAATRTSVLLLGETGTGKEVTARFIHARSTRAAKPFIAINCAALPETLLESELFGHEAGAFTGATAQKLGRFELADGGTLFLDEIGDISLSTQIKLLRVLQEREFVRVGGTRTLSCDVRIIAATNRDLQKAMAQGAFREDLYYRLNVFPVQLPPLRERREDIPLLVQHFAEASARQLGQAAPLIDEAAMARLAQYRWPGNIRELRNVIERAVLLAEGGAVTPQHLPPELGSGEATAPLPGESVLAGTERAAIVNALRANGWNQTRTAKALGITRDNLRYRLRKYGIERPSGE